MIWFVVWTVLVLATVAGGFFLLRHVYRSGKALVTAAGRAAEVFERLEERSAELAEAAEAAHPVEPVTIDDPERARRIWAASAEVKAARRERRDARREATYRRWLSFSR